MTTFELSFTFEEYVSHTLNVLVDIIINIKSLEQLVFAYYMSVRDYLISSVKRNR